MSALTPSDATRSLFTVNCSGWSTDFNHRLKRKEKKSKALKLIIINRHTGFKKKSPLQIITAENLLCRFQNLQACGTLNKVEKHREETCTSIPSPKLCGSSQTWLTKAGGPLHGWCLVTQSDCQEPSDWMGAHLLRSITHCAITPRPWATVRQSRCSLYWNQLHTDRLIDWWSLI